MAGIASAIMAGAAVAGAASSVYGAVKKGQGVADNTAAQNAITQAQFNRVINQTQNANDIATWYNGQSKDLADQTQANSTKTIAGADGGAFTTARQGAETSRAASGNALIDGLTPASNYSDNAPDATGTVKSENARKLVQALDFGHARANAGAAVNSYGDALLNGGLNIQRGNEGQAAINSQQKRTDAIANLRGNLNVQENQPIISPEAQYGLTAPVGSGAFQNGQLLQAGGNVLGAAAANGVGGKFFNGLFAPANIPGAGVPGAAGMNTFLTSGGGSAGGLFGGLFA